MFYEYGLGAYQVILPSEERISKVNPSVILVHFCR